MSPPDAADYITILQHNASDAPTCPTIRAEVRNPHRELTMTAENSPFIHEKAEVHSSSIGNKTLVWQY